MNMSGESLLVILIVGLVAGWLAGQIVQGTGLGLIGDLVVGIAGAFIASWAFPQLGIHLGSGIVAAIISAAIARSGSGLRAAWVKLRTNFSRIMFIGRRVRSGRAVPVYQKKGGADPDAQRITLTGH